jgi:hypothetical protein
MAQFKFTVHYTEVVEADSRQAAVNKFLEDLGIGNYPSEFGDFINENINVEEVKTGYPIKN